MTSFRALSRVRILAAALAVAYLAGCSMPHMMGMGSYYEVTDPATGKVYFADELNPEDRDAVEFRDGATGAWISLPAADYRKISPAEYQAGLKR